MPGAPGHTKERRGECHWSASFIYDTWRGTASASVFPLCHLCGIFCRSLDKYGRGVRIDRPPRTTPSVFLNRHFRIRKGLHDFSNLPRYLSRRGEITTTCAFSVRVRVRHMKKRSGGLETIHHVASYLDYRVRRATIRIQGEQPSEASHCRACAGSHHTGRRWPRQIFFPSLPCRNHNQPLVFPCRCVCPLLLEPGSP